MRDFPSFVGAAVLGAVLALAGHWLLATPPVAEPRTVGPGASPAARSATDAAPVDLARIEGQLAKLTFAVTALEQRFDGAVERMPARAQVDGPAAFDGDAMVRAIDKARERQERARLDALPAAELRAMARALLYDKKDSAGARQMLETLLERPLDNLERGAVLTDLGIVQRDAQNLPASEKALLGAIDLLGIDSSDGAWAAFQLAWTAHGRKDDVRALAVFDSVARSAGVGEGLRFEARWNAAKLALAAGDAGRARADFESLLRECGSKESYGHIVKDIQARLKGM